MILLYYYIIILLDFYILVFLIYYYIIILLYYHIVILSYYYLCKRTNVPTLAQRTRRGAFRNARISMRQNVFLGIAIFVYIFLGGQFFDNFNNKKTTIKTTIFKISIGITV